MARVVILGAGFAGHTAALYLGQRIGREHQVTVVNRHDFFGFVPSWVWVGIGHMAPEKTTFKLKPVYDRMHVNLVVGKATEVHPDPDEQYVLVAAAEGALIRIDYDYLLIATGPKLDWEATPGLDPDMGHTVSICTLPHAVEARGRYFQMVERMKRGDNVRFVIGTGHGQATCQGAAFEYLTNVHKDLLRRGLRKKASLTWLSNEPVPGDFGMDGIQMQRGFGLYTSETFVRTIFDDAEITGELQRAVRRVDERAIYWEDYEGTEGETAYDFAMLIPQFRGVPLRYVGENGEDLAEKLTNQSGLVLVDGIYGLPYDRLIRTPDAWPAIYQNPTYPNVFAAGIAFAPPGPISEPHVNPKGTNMTAAPPRTGMVSGIIGRIVALNIVDLITTGRMTHSERMTEMFATCIASMGASLWDGRAVVINVYPVVPDRGRHPNPTGRDMSVCYMEMGLSGAWMKRMIHATFMWKLRARPGWTIIPE
jgi:sulfide:quinone oxidoreductase